jgi:hypothetical protein
MMNNMYDTDADCTQVTMTALKKKHKVTKCSNYRKIRKDSSGTWEEALEGKVRMCLEKFSLDLQQEKE